MSGQASATKPSATANSCDAPARTPALGPWSLLLAAGLLEIVWSLALKNAHGLERPGWTAFGLVLAMASLGLLSLALRNLPVGTGYAVWVGIGAVGVAAAGMLFLGEPTTPARLAALCLVVAGVVGLSLSDRPAPGPHGPANGVTPHRPGDPEGHPAPNRLGEAH